MKKRCLGCGYEYEGAEDSLCPRSIGNNKQCGCYTEKAHEDTKGEMKPAKKAKGEINGSD